VELRSVVLPIEQYPTGKDEEARVRQVDSIQTTVQEALVDEHTWRLADTVKCRGCSGEDVCNNFEMR